MTKPHNYEAVLEKTALREHFLFLTLRSPNTLPANLHAKFHPEDAMLGHDIDVVHSPHDRQQITIIFDGKAPLRPGRLTFQDADNQNAGTFDLTARDLATGFVGDGPTKPEPTGQGNPTDTIRRRVTMERTAADDVPGMHLWSAIRCSSQALSFCNFSQFVDLAFSSKVQAAVTKGGGDPQVLVDALSKEVSTDAPALFRIDAYDRLKIVADIFVLVYGGVRPIDGGPSHHEFQEYLGGANTLPYLQVVYDRLGVKAPILNESAQKQKAAECSDLLDRKAQMPCLIELIWSYWHEEAMQVQTMAAITQRFQNLRAPGERDPLSQLEVDPLRPLNHLLWRHAQSENDRLSVLRRAHEYEAEYGFSLHGKAVAGLRASDRRSKFLEAFHNLLYRCVQFYRQDDDTTHVADGFPVLNALKETHYVLSLGAHNQFGDLPSTARQEMLIEQWLLSRPEMREFLGGRAMVAYPETWMDRVDTVKGLKGWSDVSVVHFHDLAVFGEQLLLSIRWDNWSQISEPDYGKQWARYWRAEVQGYIHAIRAALGVDLAADITNTRDASERYLPPSVHLRRRLVAQAAQR